MLSQDITGSLQWNTLSNACLV